MPNLNQVLPPLLAPLDKDEILAYLKELKPALQKDGIVELGLFGSYAKGTASASSDIDIVIRTSDEFHKKCFFDEMREIWVANKEQAIADAYAFDGAVDLIEENMD